MNILEKAQEVTNIICKEITIADAISVLECKRSKKCNSCNRHKYCSVYDKKQKPETQGKLDGIFKENKNGNS